MRITQLGFLILALNALVGCGHMPARQKGDSNPDFLSGNNPKAAKAEDMRKDLERSAGSSGWVFNVRIYATPVTRPYAEAKAREAVEESAFKEKWPEDKKDKELATMIKAATKDLDNKLCFDITIRTNDPSAIDSKVWHGDLKVEGEAPLSVKFSEFVGYSNTTHTARTSGGYTSVSKTTSYNMFGSACTDKPANLTKPFQLSVDPRYEKNLKPLILTWGKFPEQAK